jgi:hypothetical protein
MLRYWGFATGFAPGHLGAKYNTPFVQSFACANCVSTWKHRHSGECVVCGGTKARWPSQLKRGSYQHKQGGR